MEISSLVIVMPDPIIHRFFEITRDKKVVWEFNEFELVGNGLACWQVLDGKHAKNLRQKLAQLK